MRLNQENLRQTLATIFGVDAQYVVPKQGNWYNPQGTENYPGKPTTWCGFKIEGTRPVTASHLVALDTTTNWSVAHKISRISLQLIGPDAEDLANSVGHWLNSSFVQAQWDAYDGKLLGASGGVIATDYDQEGENTILAYNVTVEIAYADEIDSKQTYPMPDFVFKGTVNVT